MQDDFKDRNTVVLAALLHDVGKPLQYAKSIRESDLTWSKYQHCELGGFVIDHLFCGKVSPEIDTHIGGIQESAVNSDFIDTDLLKYLVVNHHQTSIRPGVSINAVGNRHACSLQHCELLLSYIKTADCGTARERSSNSAAPDDDVRLTSLFSNMQDHNQKAKYASGILTKDNIQVAIFPSDKELDSEQKRNRVKHMLTDLSDVVVAMAGYRGDKYFDTLLSLIDLTLYKHLWAWPSTRRYQDEKDIALYDHLRMSSAIAAGLYDVRDVETARFRLLGGDFGGIQKYIFDITSRNAAKRLRARSFYVQALTESILHFILDELVLPQTCVIKNAGGNFIMLVPEGIHDHYVALNQQIQQQVFEEFQGELVFTLALGDAFTLKQWNEKPKDESSTTGYSMISKAFADKLQNRKLQPFRDILQKDGIWLKTGTSVDLTHRRGQACLSPTVQSNKTNPTKNDETWTGYPFVVKQLTNAGRCPACGMTTSDMIDDKEDNACDQCRRDKENGKELTTANYIAYPEKDIIPKFRLIKKLGKEFQNDRITAINPEFFDEKKGGGNLLNNLCPMSMKLMANYVPTVSAILDTNNKLPQRLKNDYAEVINKYKNLPAEEDDHIASEQDCLHFKALAEMSDGAPMLAVLKADVDDLGSIFSPERLKEKYTPSRIATLSRLLDMFFSGYLETLVRTEYPQCYFVYAGGDDLVIIGPWNVIIKLAQHIHQEFDRFVSGNPRITLSAGISFFKPKYPILKAIEQAEAQLELAKELPGKNGLALFNEAIIWKDETQELFQLSSRLKELLKTEAVSTAYIYQLLTFAGMVNGHRNKDKMWRALFHYLTVRNYQDKDCYEELMEMETTLASYGNKFKIPICLALYSQRGKRKGD